MNYVPNDLARSLKQRSRRTIRSIPQDFGLPIVITCEKFNPEAIFNGCQTMG
ncbi:hypothetical protein IMSAG025_01623 [Muribaculaceae bacterium]|nr:hypothetical protein IMSAG025_01623 [Muribaculaceae bacterium]